jgi:hypothetical protein
MWKILLDECKSLNEKENFFALVILMKKDKLQFDYNRLKKIVKIIWLNKMLSLVNLAKWRFWKEFTLEIDGSNILLFFRKVKAFKN